MAWSGEAGESGFGMARSVGPRHGLAGWGRRGVFWHAPSRLVLTWHGEARQARRVGARQDKTWCVPSRQASLVAARSGVASRGLARPSFFS